MLLVSLDTLILGANKCPLICHSGSCSVSVKPEVCVVHSVVREHGDAY